MSENETVQVLLFGNKSFSKDINFRIITSSISFIKDNKNLMNHFLLERNLFDIFSREKQFENIFSPPVSVIYVTYLL